jgi:hypothetical protein
MSRAMIHTPNAIAATKYTASVSSMSDARIFVIMMRPPECYSVTRQDANA